MALLLSRRFGLVPSQLQRSPLCRSHPIFLRHVPLLSRHASYSSEAETAKVAADDTDAMSVEGSAVIISETEPAADAAAPSGVASHPLTDMFGAQELLSELRDQDQFGKRGEAWAFAQIAVLALVLFPPFTLTGLVDILATLLITAGVVFAVYALFCLGRSISPFPAPRKKHELVTSGMYNYVRHPMYAGLLMVAFGLAIISRSETRLAMAALLWFVLEKKAGLEEKWLQERYGQLYQDYKAKVKKFFPFIY